MTKPTPGPWFVHEAAVDDLSPMDVTVRCNPEASNGVVTVAFMGPGLTGDLQEARANARFFVEARELRTRTEAELAAKGQDSMAGAAWSIALRTEEHAQLLREALTDFIRRDHQNPLSLCAWDILNQINRPESGEGIPLPVDSPLRKLPRLRAVPQSEIDGLRKVQQLIASRNASYSDANYPERACDYCGKPYRGPAVYCSFECAIADA